MPKPSNRSDFVSGVLDLCNYWAAMAVGDADRELMIECLRRRTLAGESEAREVLEIFREVNLFLELETISQRIDLAQGIEHEPLSFDDDRASRGELLEYVRRDLGHRD